MQSQMSKLVKEVRKDQKKSDELPQEVTFSKT